MFPLAKKSFASLRVVLVLTLLVGQLLLPGHAQTLATKTTAPPEIFRLSRTVIPAGAEIITIHARWDDLAQSGERWVPVVSILRDTLNDTNPENDRLRYVWPLSYTRPTLWQRFSGAVPFLYRRVGNKTDASNKPPPAIDLASPDREVWEKLMWVALQNVFLDPYGMPLKASTRSYRRNLEDYRKSHIVRALAVLSLYQSMQGQANPEPIFNDSEMAEIQARLLLTDKTFGGLIDNLKLEPYYHKELVQTRDSRGHNWELLRQRAEAESLYFEPLQMPDGSMTHALLWVAKEDLETNQGQRYDGRFLNIADPWSDNRLLNWEGHVEERYFDESSRPVAPETPGAQKRELIPLALYGLDNPKIPMLLVDFRDAMNPKKREMSRRLLQDVTRDVLSLSSFGNLPYFVGRSVFDFVTGRRGIDVNQPTRLRTYAQLKLLLALNQSLDPNLRKQLSSRIESVSLNPMENSLEAEAKVAEQQYAALLNYAARKDGLSAQLERDRRAELVPLEHGKAERFFFRLANVLTFGKYVHREALSAEMEDRLDVARRLNFHTRFLREVSRSGPNVDVKWNLEDVQRSLRFVAEHGEMANTRAIAATIKIFSLTGDDETRRACLESLASIPSSKARAGLVRISRRDDLDESLKELVGLYIADPTFRAGPLTSSINRPTGTSGQQ